jgi:hypothetical protein
MIGPERKTVTPSTGRIGKQLLAYLRAHEGYLGVVEWQKEKDACLIDFNRSPIYLQNPGSLKTPLSIALDSSALLGSGVRALTVGDRLHKRESCIVRLPDQSWSFDLSQATAVDLNRTLRPYPANQALSRYREVLARGVYRQGNFEGLAGLLSLVPGAPPSAGDDRRRPSTWCQHALEAVMLLLDGARARDGHIFAKGWERLTGLGPGFTPSGDDLLLGFLAAHRMWSSPFWQMTVDSPLRKSLQATASRTTILSSALLRSALEGSFAETIFRLFEALISEPDKTGGAIEELLRTGNSTGSDLLTGVILGLMTLMTM